MRVSLRRPERHFSRDMFRLVPASVVLDRMTCRSSKIVGLPTLCTMSPEAVPRLYVTISQLNAVYLKRRLLGAMYTYTLRRGYTKRQLSFRCATPTSCRSLSFSFEKSVCRLDDTMTGVGFGHRLRPWGAEVAATCMPLKPSLGVLDDLPRGVTPVHAPRRRRSRTAWPLKASRTKLSC